jgi:hypothetical protein
LVEAGIGEGMRFIQDDHWETALVLDQIDGTARE